MNIGFHPDMLSLADAITLLFDMELSKQPQIKHALNSLVRNNVISNTKESLGGGLGSRSRIWIHPDQLNLIFNAVILQGLFSETKKITKILEDSGKCNFRHEMADFAQVILLGRQSIVGISLLPDEVRDFINMLGSDTSLIDKRLPNPFKKLPQLVLSENTSTIQAILAQSTVLSEGDTMMIHYLNGDLNNAWVAAQKLDTADSTLIKYKSLIEREYVDAQEFDELLDILK